MKISQLIVTTLCLGLGGAAVYYSVDQDKVMNLLLAVHGGGPNVEDGNATGLRKENQELERAAAQISSERNDAVKQTEQSQNVMNDQHAQRDDAELVLRNHQRELADVQAKVKEAQANIEQLRNAFNEALEQLNASGLNFSISPGQSYMEVLEQIKTLIAKEQAREKKLAGELKDALAKHKAAAEKLYGEKVELARATRTNTAFFKEYTKNDDEYVIDAVDPRWNYVCFNVGMDSGLIVGDTTSLQVRRSDNSVTPLRIRSIDSGEVIADYDPKKLPGGIRPQVGDVVFRIKPQGR